MASLITTSSLRHYWREWLDHCGSGAWANPTFYGKTIGGVPTVWVDPVKALERALMSTGYQATSRWAYNFRGIGGAPCSCSQTSRCSIHAYGVAIDIDPALNPYTTRAFSWGDTAFTPEQIAAVEGIRNTKGEQLWTWGGRWTSIRDYMHFQARVDPGSTDVDWSTVPDGDYEDGEDGMIYSTTQNSTHPNVKLYQQALLEWDHGALPEWGADGDFGDETKEWVERFQSYVGLEATGVLDPDSQHFLAGFHPSVVPGGVVGPQGPEGPQGPQGKRGPRGPSPTGADFTYE